MGRKKIIYIIILIVSIQACGAAKKVETIEIPTPTTKNKENKIITNKKTTVKTQITKTPTAKITTPKPAVKTPQTDKSQKIHTTTFGEIKKAGKLWGLDLSHYQEVVDWDKLKNQKPDFIFLKASEGMTIQDEKYSEYYRKIRRLEIPVGSYHFFSYKSTGKEQAKNFLSTAKYKEGDLPLVLDAEYAKTMPASATVVKELLAFMTALYTKYGRYPMIYCNYNYYLQYLKDNLPVKCKLWIVDYRGKPDCTWTFWQTTDRFNVDGIKGKVDFNLFNGTRQDFKKLLRQE